MVLKGLLLRNPKIDFLIPTLGDDKARRHILLYRVYHRVWKPCLAMFVLERMSFSGPSKHVCKSWHVHNLYLIFTTLVLPGATSPQLLNLVKTWIPRWLFLWPKWRGKLCSKHKFAQKVASQMSIDLSRIG